MKPHLGRTPAVWQGIHEHSNTQNINSTNTTQIIDTNQIQELTADENIIVDNSDEINTHTLLDSESQNIPAEHDALNIPTSPKPLRRSKRKRKPPNRLSP